MEEDVGPSEASGLLSMLQRYQGVMAVVAAVAAVGVGLYFARHTVPGSTINAKLFNLYALAEKVRAIVLLHALTCSAECLLLSPGICTLALMGLFSTHHPQALSYTLTTQAFISPSINHIVTVSATHELSSHAHATSQFLNNLIITGM